MDNYKQLYDSKETIGSNLLSIISDKGYTKSSISKMTDVSRPTLDKIIKGEIDSVTTFTTHITKIITALKINVDDLLSYNNKIIDNQQLFVFSNNSPVDHKPTENAQIMFESLNEIIHLCKIYCKGR